MIAALLTCAALTMNLNLPKPPALDEPKLLDAIRQVENWDGKTLGTKGEWGPWQLTPGVFKSYIRTGVTVRKASPAQLREAAHLHLAWLVSMLEEHHLPVTAYSVGLAWGAGFEAVRTDAASKAKRDYAQRVANLYWEDKSAQSANAVPKSNRK